MFQYTEDCASTGEPPTPPSQTTTTVSGSTQTASTSTVGPQQSMDHSSVAQEPDSGYEASPSSVVETGNRSHRFFSDPEGNNEPPTPGESDYEFPDHPSIFLIMDSESEGELDLEDWDVCQDCGSATCSSSCNRTDSTATPAQGLCNCDICDSTSSCIHNCYADSRPSSLPIQIPTNQSQMARRSLFARSGPDVDLRLLPTSRSQPLERPTRYSLVESVRVRSLPSTNNHPLSWPSNLTSWNLQRCIPLNFRMSLVWWQNFRRHHQHRNRRLIIDSDASSYSSEDGPEDVFRDNEHIQLLQNNTSDFNIDLLKA